MAKAHIAQLTAEFRQRLKASGFIFTPIKTSSRSLLYNISKPNDQIFESLPEKLREYYYEFIEWNNSTEE